ncbi:MAG: pantetheine-phosphate adenylyltransferase [Christensenellaceae bacterium]
MKKCVYAGSFDPVTKGHIAIIEKCAMMFDEVIVAIGINDQKKYLYSKEERKKMLELSCSRLRNVTVKCFDNLLADFMREEGVVYYVRGIRNQKDVEWEEKSFEFNSGVNPDIITMFFKAPKEVQNVSSTQVKELLKQHKSVKKYVPEEALEIIEKRKSV